MGVPRGIIGRSTWDNRENRTSICFNMFEHFENYEKCEKRSETDGTSPSSALKTIPHPILIQIHPTRPPDDVKNNVFQPNPSRKSRFSAESVQKIAFVSRICPKNTFSEPFITHPSHSLNLRTYVPDRIRKVFDTNDGLLRKKRKTANRQLSTAICQPPNVPWRKKKPLTVSRLLTSRSRYAHTYVRTLRTYSPGREGF